MCDDCFTKILDNLDWLDDVVDCQNDPISVSHDHAKITETIRLINVIKEQNEELVRSNIYLTDRAISLAQEKIKVLAACKSLYKHWKTLHTVLSKIPYLTNFIQ